jgi:hypothetical protein
LTPFTAAGATSRARVKFSTVVPLLATSQVGNGSVKVTGTYNADLRAEGIRYQRRLPLAHSVEPGGFDRFQITMRAPRSSMHQFRIRFRLTSGEEVISQPIELTFFLPRSLTHFERMRDSTLISQTD